MMSSLRPLVYTPTTVLVHHVASLVEILHVGSERHTPRALPRHPGSGSPVWSELNVVGGVVRGRRRFPPLPRLPRLGRLLDPPQRLLGLDQLRRGSPDRVHETLHPQAFDGDPTLFLASLTRPLRYVRIHALANDRLAVAAQGHQVGLLERVHDLPHRRSLQAVLLGGQTKLVDHELSKVVVAHLPAHRSLVLLVVDRYNRLLRGSSIRCSRVVPEGVFRTKRRDVLGFGVYLPRGQASSRLREAVPRALRRPSSNLEDVPVEIRPRDQTADDDKGPG